jgi:hypothetical protein
MENKKITDLINNNLKGKVTRKILKEIDSEIENNGMDRIEEELEKIDIIDLFSIKSNIENHLSENRGIDAFLNKPISLFFTTIVTAWVGGMTGYIGSSSKNYNEVLEKLENFQYSILRIGGFLLILFVWLYLRNISNYKYNHNNRKLLLLIDHVIEKKKNCKKRKTRKKNKKYKNKKIKSYLNDLINSKVTMMKNIDNIIKVFHKELYSTVRNRINELAKFKTGDISKVLKSYDLDKLIDLKFVIENINYFRLVDKQIIACLLFLSSSILGALYTGTLEASFSLKGWLIIGCLVIFTITSYSVKILFPKLGVKEEYLLSLIKKAIKDKDK